MSRSLKSFTRDRDAAVSRRLRENTGGLGYWAAVDAERRRSAEQHRRVTETAATKRAVA